VAFVVAGARFYFRGRRFWEKRGNAELAELIGDRWVLVPGSVAGELTPVGNEAGGLMERAAWREAGRAP
jgi:hypothetical protein